MVCMYSMWYNFSSWITAFFKAAKIARGKTEIKTHQVMKTEPNLAENTVFGPIALNKMMMEKTSFHSL